MKKLLFGLILASCFTFVSMAQSVTAPKFGKGLINIMASDSTFSMKFGMRFQNLVTSTWTKQDEADGGSFGDTETNFLIRRARFKFGGYAYTPKLQYKMELGLSNRDQSGGGTSEFSNAPRYILDAWVQYQINKNWAVKFGQGKLPGNRERVISSGNLQFVDRSRLNSRFNIDRDFGLHLIHTANPTADVFTKVIAVIYQGEGRNVSSGNVGRLGYTIRGEILPFGKFASKGDYIGSSIKRESSPKLSLGVSYDRNNKAGKSRGQNGSFLDVSDQDSLKTLSTVFADLMFKYQGFSVMAEYANKKTTDDNPLVTEDGIEIGTYYTGSGISVQAGYMFDSNYEIAIRYTSISPDLIVDQDDKRYTLGLNKFIVGHKLKLQTDLTYRDRAVSNDELTYRLQMDLHF